MKSGLTLDSNMRVDYDRMQAKEIVKQIFRDKRCIFDKEQFIEAIKEPGMQSPKKSEANMSPSAHLRLLQQKLYK